MADGLAPGTGCASPLQGFPVEGFGTAPFGSRGAVSTATNPIFLWVASQNGLLLEWPQRHSTTAFPGGTTNGTPSASTIVIGPVTFNGPFSRTVMVTSLMQRL